MELKLNHLTDCRIELSDHKAKNGAHVISGYASSFGNVDSYGDTVLPGAYRKTLRNRERPIRMRWNHSGPVIGIWTSIAEDNHGLKVTGELTPGHSTAENVYASLKHGAVDGLSIGYVPIRGDKNEHGGRTLSEIELIEISPVEDPADLGATITGVKADELFASETSHLLTTLEDVERYLRNSREWSASESKAFIHCVRRIVKGETKHKDTLQRIAERLHGANALNRLMRTGRQQ